MPILEAQKAVFLELKKRNHISKSNFEEIQQELKSVVYFSELSKSTKKLEQFLETTYRG